MWTYDAPEESGWYWVIYTNYENPEVVYLRKDLIDSVYSAGQLETKNFSHILMWSKEKLQIPEK